MLYKTFKNEIELINEWAINTGAFDIGIFKMWIRFEKYISDLFVLFCVGESSETGYLPKRKVIFNNRDSLEKILKNKNQSYVDYKEKIQNISNEIFIDNPFEILFIDAKYKDVYNKIYAIRNYVAHESGAAKNKYIENFFGGDITKFIEPNEYLKNKRKRTKVTNYTYLKESLLDMAKLLLH